MSTLTRKFNIGDRVTFPADAMVKASLVGVVFVVTEVPMGRRTNYRVRAEHGGPVYATRPDMLVPAPPAGEAPPVGRPFVEHELFTAGECVTVTNGARKGIDPAQPYVVLKHDGGDRVNITKLGGDGSRYWRWPVSGVKRCDLGAVAEWIVDNA